VLSRRSRLAPPKEAAAGVIPIVFVAVADPIVAGLVSNLARRGGTVTGLSTLVPAVSWAGRSSY
jgi:ABC-type uncharacterized transport system substrate-binding protein